MDTSDAVLTGVRVVLAAVSLVLVVAGVRIAVTRRLPRPRLGADGGPRLRAGRRPWLRVGSGPAGQRPQPVRVGGGVALVGTSLLIQQAAHLVPMPRTLAIALGVLALAVTIVALVWFLLRHD